MASNTVGVIQKFATVPAGKPNQGANSYDDATEADILTQAGLSDDTKREGKVSNLVASAISNSFDPLLAKIIYFDMDSNITSLTISNDGLFNGQVALLIFQQDSIGSRLLTWDASKFQGGLDQGVPVLNGSANSRDYVLITWNSANLKFDFLSHDRRYP